jgi:mono/diheme cytochrome c family protein
MPRSKSSKPPFTFRRYWGWLLAAAATALAVLFLFFPKKPPQQPADWRDVDVVARGESIYQEHCSVCHGPAAKGENPAQPMGGEKDGGGYLAPALNGSGHAWHHRPETIFQVIKEGSPAADSPMRGFRDRLSDEQISWVSAYLRSLWPQQIQDRYEQMLRH